MTQEVFSYPGVGETLELIGGGPPGPQGPPGVGIPGPPGPMLAPTFASTAVTSATITLKDMNEWTVAAPVQVSLAATDTGAQHTVHIKSGFQNITWPNGTEVFGLSSADSTWVSIVRVVSGWRVLIASGTGGGVGSGGGSDFSVTNLFPNPLLTTPSANVNINTVGGPQGTEALEAGVVSYTGPGGCLRVVGSSANNFYKVNIRMPNLTPGRQYEVRFSYLVAGVPSSTTIPTGLAGAVRTYTPPSSNADLTQGFNPSQLLIQASTSATVGKWQRLFPVRFTAPSAPTEAWVVFPVGPYDVSFKDVLVTEVTNTDWAIRDSFIPGVTIGAAWHGTENNSLSTLSVLRASDIGWISQWKTARFKTPLTAVTDPEFMHCLSYPGSSTVVSTTPNPVINENYTRIPGTNPAWRGVHDGTPNSLLYGYRFGETEFLQNGAWATPAEWEVSKAAGVSFGEVACTYRGGIAFWKFVNVAAKVANPTGPIIVINERERPLQDVYAPVMTSAGAFVTLKVTALTGAVTIMGSLPLGASLGIAAAPASAVPAMVSWAVQ